MRKLSLFIIAALVLATPLVAQTTYILTASPQNMQSVVDRHGLTVINPRGTTLTPGMNVDVNGSVQSDHSLNADTITAH